MNTSVRFLVVCISVLLLGGCTSLMKINYLSENGAQLNEPMLIATRPHEFGLDTVADSSGEAYYAKLLIFTIAGDKPDVSLPILGNVGRDPLETLACYRAAIAKGGDAFYAINSEWDKANWFWIYRTKNIKVTGKAMKIKDLGLMSPERSDNLFDQRPIGAIKKESQVNKFLNKLNTKDKLQ